MSDLPERTVVVRNPASSLAERVNTNVMNPLYAALPRSSVVELWTPGGSRADNIAAIAEAIEPGDRLLVAAGDGTSNAVANAYVQANVQGSKIGFLPYGNFNDMAATFTSKSAVKNPLLLLDGTAKETEVLPLTVTVNNEHYAQAVLYSSIGWTATAAALFGTPESKRGFHSGHVNLTKSLMHIATMYFKTRNDSVLPEFMRDGDESTHTNTTDVLAINGPIMAKIIKSQRNYYSQATFLRCDLNVSKFFKNSQLLGRSGLNFMFGTALGLPGKTVSVDSLTFNNAAVTIQVDGEYDTLAGVNMLSVTKDSHANAPTITVLKTAK